MVQSGSFNIISKYFHNSISIFMMWWPILGITFSTFLGLISADEQLMCIACGFPKVITQISSHKVKSFRFTNCYFVSRWALIMTCMVAMVWSPGWRSTTTHVRSMTASTLQQQTSLLEFVHWGSRAASISQENTETKVRLKYVNVLKELWKGGEINDNWQL